MKIADFLWEYEDTYRPTTILLAAGYSNLALGGFSWKVKDATAKWDMYTDEIIINMFHWAVHKNEVHDWVNMISAESLHIALFNIIPELKAMPLRVWITKGIDALGLHYGPNLWSSGLNEKVLEEKALSKHPMSGIR